MAKLPLGIRCIIYSYLPEDVQFNSVTMICKSERKQIVSSTLSKNSKRMLIITNHQLDSIFDRCENARFPRYFSEFFTSLKIVFLPYEDKSKNELMKMNVESVKKFTASFQGYSEYFKSLEVIDITMHYLSDCVLKWFIDNEIKINQLEIYRTIKVIDFDTQKFFLSAKKICFDNSSFFFHDRYGLGQTQISTEEIENHNSKLDGDYVENIGQKVKRYLDNQGRISPFYCDIYKLYVRFPQLVDLTLSYLIIHKIEDIDDIFSEIRPSIERLTLYLYSREYVDFTPSQLIVTVLKSLKELDNQNLQLTLNYSLRYYCQDECQEFDEKVDRILGILRSSGFQVDKLLYDERLNGNQVSYIIDHRLDSEVSDYDSESNDDEDSNVEYYDESEKEKDQTPQPSRTENYSVKIQDEVGKSVVINFMNF